MVTGVQLSSGSKVTLMLATTVVGSGFCGSACWLWGVADASTCQVDRRPAMPSRVRGVGDEVDLSYVTP